MDQRESLEARKEANAEKFTFTDTAIFEGDQDDQRLVDDQSGGQAIVKVIDPDVESPVDPEDPFYSAVFVRPTRAENDWIKFKAESYNDFEVKPKETKELETEIFERVNDSVGFNVEDLV